MAEHRMLSKQFFDSQLMDNISDGAFRLYIQLCLNADDDGFINNAERITRSFGRTEDELIELWHQELLIKFSTNIYLIKHWKIHNQIQKDRYTRTNHVEEFKLITWNDSDKIYRTCEGDCLNGLQLIEKWFSNAKEPKYQLTYFDKLPPQNVNILYPNCIQPVSKVYTQDKISKDSISKFNIAEHSEASNFNEETQTHKLVDKRYTEIRIV